MKNNVVRFYIPIESMTKKEYEQWIEEGGSPTKDKWIINEIKKNTQKYDNIIRW